VFTIKRDENRVNTLISLAKQVNSSYSNILYKNKKEMLMHTIFCCVCAKKIAWLIGDGLRLQVY
jgi:hypothetical protein